jgi:hypothetical protein
MLPPISGLEDVDTGRNQTPINALNQTGTLENDFEGLVVKMNESKSMAEI